MTFEQVVETFQGVVAGKAGVEDEPEGTVMVEFSLTLIREMAMALEMEWNIVNGGYRRMACRVGKSG